MRDDFDERVVAEVSDISAGGSEVEGAVEWVLAESLEPGAEQTVSYEVRLIGEIGQSTEADHTATISISGVELARAQTTMTIEPTPEEAEAVLEQPQVFEQKPEALAWLVGVMTGAALLVVVAAALGGPYLMKDKWSVRYFMVVIEGVAVIVIVGAVLILAMGSGIKQDGAVPILSGIAGYVLGRSLSGSGDS